MIKELPDNYVHPTGITGWTWGLYEDGELIATSFSKEDLKKLVEFRDELKNIPCKPE